MNRSTLGGSYALSHRKEKKEKEEDEER